VAGEAEPCDIGAAVDEVALSEGSSGFVESGHEFAGGKRQGIAAKSAFDGGGDDSAAECFSEHEVFAGFGVGIGEVAVWVHNTSDGESVNRLGVSDRVAAYEAAFGIDTHLRTTSEDGLDGFVIDKIGGHAGDGECGDRASAHGVNI